MKRFETLVLLCLTVGCGGHPATGGLHPPVLVSVVPASVSLQAGAVQAFIASVSGTDETSVEWSVRDGGGTISNSGIYQAPPTAGVAHVVATSKADPRKTATAEALIAPPVTVSIEPASVSLGAGVSIPVQFKAMVTGTADSAVAWCVREGAAAGTVDGSGRFVSSGTPGVFHVIATSHADSSRSASADVTVAYTTDLIDHAGPVSPETRTFLLLWGDSNAFMRDTRAVLEAFLKGLQGSSYLAILNQYLRGASASTTWAGTFSDSSSPPTSVTTAIVGDAACHALIASGATPRPGDFVLVVTSNVPDDMVGCAWHASTACNGQNILFAYAPNSVNTNCGNAKDVCNTGLSSPTISLSLMASHELFESITDPFGTAWLTKGGFEVMDGCGDTACVPLSTGTASVYTAYSNAAHMCVSQ